jgi:2-polyprenyl-3-methyl-5-hydroxy-6-metoxy-1,4-benzoquinol methylase
MVLLFWRGPVRTEDTDYGEEYWQSLDGGRGYHDSLLWEDIGHVIHELVGVDKVHGIDNALNLRLLDVGCAFGMLLRHLRRRGYDVRGVDYSRYALAHAPKDIEYYLAWHDLTSQEQLADWYKPFDVVTCFETLEHLPWEHSRGAVEQIWRVLKPGGLFIATICVVGQPDTRSDPTHVTVIPRECWHALFDSVGFEYDRQMCRQLRWFWLFSQHQGVFVLRRPA